MSVFNFLFHAPLFILKGSLESTCHQLCAHVFVSRVLVSVYATWVAHIQLSSYFPFKLYSLSRLDNRLYDHLATVSMQHGHEKKQRNRWVKRLEKKKIQSIENCKYPTWGVEYTMLVGECKFFSRLMANIT